MTPKRVQTRVPLRTKVEVTWRDSTSRGGWDTVASHRKRCDVGPCYSVGYLLTKNKDVVQLAQSQSSTNQDVNDTITIPREAIQKIRRLR